jgi:hypothetical protein
MKIIRTFVSCLLAMCAVMSAISGAEQEPMLTMSLHDGKRIAERFNNSIYAKLWAERALEPARAKFNEWLADGEKEIGIPPLAVFQALRSGDIRIMDWLPPDPNAKIGKRAGEPSMLFQADVGDFAQQLFTSLEKSAKNRSDFSFPGADQAMIDTNKKNPSQSMVAARFGPRLLIQTKTDQLHQPYAFESSKADITLAVNYRELMSKLENATGKDKNTTALMSVMKSVDNFLNTIRYEGTISEKGFLETFSQGNTYPGLIPVDQTILSRLPLNTLAAYAFGFSSKPYWDIFEPVMLESMAQQGMSLTSKQIEENILAALKEKNIDLTYDDIKNSINGTLLIAVSPGAPFPSFTVAVPRSIALDAGITYAAELFQWKLPNDGMSESISFPNVPLPMSLLRDKSHWIISSDPLISTAWFAHDGGWANSTAVKTALSQCSTNTCAIGASDTPAVLRAAAGFLPLIPFSDPKHKQMVTVLLARAAQAAGTGYLIADVTPESWTMRSHSIVGVGMVPILSGALVAFVQDKKISSNDASVTTALKAGVFPAQIQFQAGGYVDQNNDNVGEYGFLHELSGGPLPGNNGTTLSLLSDDWNMRFPEMHGHTFACWLPDGNGGALGPNDGERIMKPNAATEQIRYFVVYAWPTDRSEKGTVYVINQSGIVRSKPVADVPLGDNGPAWNAVFDGKGWADPETWPPVKKK